MKLLAYNIPFITFPLPHFFFLSNIPSRNTHKLGLQEVLPLVVMAFNIVSFPFLFSLFLLFPLSCSSYSSHKHDTSKKSHQQQHGSSSLPSNIQQQSSSLDKKTSDHTNGKWILLHKSIGVSAMHMQLLHNNKVVIFDRTDFGSSNLSLPQGKCRYD